MTDTAKAEIQKMWGIFEVENDSVLELRALPPAGHDPKPPITEHFRAVDYKDLDACKREFEEEALRLNAVGYNIYIVMNPIKADLVGHAARDEDIVCRKLLLIDIDRAAKATEPASHAEVEAARLLANDIVGYLSDHSFPNPLRVMSGNGHHLYYGLKGLPNTPTTTKTVETALRNLAQKFDNGQVKVDTSVFNASRITKVPGTIMRKGGETTDRPYRMPEGVEE